MTEYDAATLPAALAAAQPGDTLIIAPGVHTFSTHLNIPADVSLWSYGSALTTLVTPTVPTMADVYGLKFSGEGTATITGMTIEGPATPTANGKYAFGIYSEGTSTTQSLTFSDVKVTRPAASAATAGFYRAMMMVSGQTTDLGARTVIIEDSDMTAANGVINMYCDADATNHTLIVRRSAFHTTSASHLFYVHPGISFSLTDVTLDDCPNYAFQHYSGQANAKARYANFKNVTFGSGLTHGVITSNQTGALTDFMGCTFNNAAASNTAIQARTSVRVWSSLFSLGSATNGITGVDDGTMEVLGCTFRYTGLIAGGGAMVVVNGGTARIESCNFDLRSLGTSSPKAISVVAASVTASANVTHCHFHASLNVKTATDAPLAVYVGAGGHATVTHSRLTGYYIPVYGAMHLNSSTGTLSVDYCTFLIKSGLRPLFQTASGGVAGAAVWGTHNTLGVGVAQPSLVS